MLACYWIEWVLEFDIISRKKRLPSTVEHRKFVKVNHKFIHDPIWIIWDSLLFYAKQPTIEKIINALLFIFSVNYTTSLCKKRRFLLYFAVDIIVKPINMNIEVVSDKTIVTNVMDRIHTIYQEIIKNQIISKSHFLIDGINPSPSMFSDSIAKLEITNSIDM